MSFLKKLFGQSEPEKIYEPKITVEKIQHLFEYGKRENLIGTGDESLRGKYKVGHLISWEAEPYFYKGYKDIPAQTVPANIKWSNNPVFAYVSILDNKVQYHYSEDCGSAVFICPTTTNTEHLKFIDEIFEHAAYNIVNGNVGYTVDYIGLLGKKGQTFNGEKADTTFKEVDIYEEYEVN